MFGISDLAADVPKLHFWDDTWQVGGFDGRSLTALHDLARACGDGRPARVIETGAGASTLALLLSGAAEVISVAPDAELFQRIRAWCDAKGFAPAALQAVEDYSEFHLPARAARMMAEAATLDLALIDGGHGWPTVFVDFCYLNAMLRDGGYLLLDDVQLHSVKELARLLKREAGFRLVGPLAGPKTLVFQKCTADRLLGDFYDQPYVTEKTRADEASGTRFALD